MKKTFFGACLGAIVYIASINALLPPFYESVKEYKALLDSPELSNYISAGEAIEVIERKQNVFFIRANKKNLKVDIVYDPQNHPGPAKFHFVFHPPEEFSY